MTISQPTRDTHDNSAHPQRSLCLRCGERKTDALAACPQCGHEPESQRDKAEHVLVEASNLSDEQLESAAEAIRAGEELEFSPDAIVTAEASFRANKPDAHWLLFYVFFAAPIGLVILWFVYRWLSGSADL